MADSFTFKIDGLQELQDRLAQMGDEIAAKNIVSSAFNANKIMVEAVRDKIESNGSVDTGLLRDSISRKRLIYDKDGVVVILTGVNKATKGVDKYGKPRVPWRYAHIVEKEKPFMRPAFESVKQQVLDEFIVNMLKKVKRFER